MLYLPFYNLSYGYDGLNGAYYLPDKDYDDKPGWSVGVNMPRKSCMTYTFFESGSMVLLGGDHSRGHTTFFAMISDKRWNFVGDEEHAVEVFYDGRLSWSGRGFGVEVSSYKGVTIENLTEDDIVSFGRGSSLALLVDGMVQGRFSLKGTRDAIHRMLGCMIDVEAGRIPLEPTPIVVPSLEARNHPETIAPRSGATPITPAPRRSGEERATPTQAVNYDRGDNWYVNIKKDDRVCVIDISLGERNIYVHSSAPSGRLEYSITFVDNDFLPEKKIYDYEIRNEKGAISSGEATAFPYRGRGYYMISGLTEKFQGDLARSRVLRVESDGSRFGEYDLSGFGKGFRRYFDCLEELGDSKPRKPPKVRRMN
ncbi:MAG: hypothetical protein H6Q99_2729 [Proteobacteria bacterium]|nr:hypothetical protein [Pseudomonadota bacterium]